MTQMEVAYSERITSNAGGASATYATQGSPQLLAASFVAGKKYLLLARGEASMAAIGAAGAVKMRHGTTDFPGSEMIYTTASLLNDRVLYQYMTVWTAVAGEDITMQNHGDGTNASQHRWCTLCAIRLSDALVENTDWFFAESTTALTLTTTAQSGASLTFTPAAAGHTWLVITDALLELDNVNDEFVTRLDHTGGATEGWDAIYGGRAVGDTRPQHNIFLGTLGAVSQTFREQARRIGTTGTTARRLRSAVFALDLSKFDVATIISSDTQINPTVTTDYSTQGATVSHDQVVPSGHCLILGYFQCSPLTDAGASYRYWTARMQNNGVDLFSTDGVTNTYTGETARPRFVDPIPHSVRTGQAFPYVLYTLEDLASGFNVVDMDFGVSALVAKGGRYFRIAVISLDVATAPPPAGAGGSPAVERNEQIMYGNDYRASRRRVRVRLVDATDNVTPEIGEAGGQGAISVNGGAFTTTGVGALVAVEASNGIYYAELTQAALLGALGSLTFRYKSANTALFTTTLAIEELPWLDDGVAAGGGTNYIDLEATSIDGGPAPTTLQAGSIIRLVGGTGAGQAALVSSYSGVRAIMEQNWDTPPVAADTRYVILPGLKPFVTDVNVKQVDGSATAATKLKAGAEALLTFTVAAGTNTTTVITTDLPVAAADFYKDRAVYFRTGALAGEEALIVASATSGALTVLTVSALSAGAAVGATGVVA